MSMLMLGFPGAVRYERDGTFPEEALLSQSARPRKPIRVVCVGGTNIDIKCRLAGRTVMGSSNPGAALVSVVGCDAFGAQVLGATAAAGVDTRGVIRTAGATGSYHAALDAAGELILGVAAMGILERLTPRRLAAQRAQLAKGDLILADSNPPIETLDWLIGFASARGLRLAIEAVSVPKSRRLRRLLGPDRPLYALFCNRAEAAAVAGSGGLRAAARWLHERGVRHVGIGLGRRGMFASDGRAA